MTTFNDLPVLVKSHIFQNLGFEDKKTARLVCKDWTFTIDKYNPSFLTYTDVPFTNNNYQTVLNAGVPIKSIDVINFTNNLSFSSTRRGNFIPGLESLTFSTCSNNCMSIVSLNGGGSSMETTSAISTQRISRCSHNCIWNESVNGSYTGTTGINMQKILEKCPQIKCLKFQRSAFVNVENQQFLKTLNLEELQILEIEMIANFNSNQHNSILALATHCHFPRLTTLNLKFFLVSKYCLKQYCKLYLRICSFIGLHKNTLKSLKFMHPGDCRSQQENIGICQQCWMNSNMVIFDGLEKISSEVLNLGTPTILKAFPLGAYEMKLALAQTSLQSLTLAGSHELSRDELENFLFTNKSTLKKFDISGLELRYSILFDISWLKDASKLRHLGLGSSTTTMNIQDLPKSLTSLTWKMIPDELEPNRLETDDLIWIVCNLKQLESLVLQDFQETRNVGGVSFEMFHGIVTALQKLQFLYLNCRHEARRIKSYIENRATYFGDQLYYRINGRIYIHRSI